MRNKKNKLSLFVGCLVLFLLSAYNLAGAEEGLIAHWNFDEGEGEILHDRSGNDNHGKIYGAKWAKCGEGHALKFDGEDDYVDCGNNPRLKIADDITIMAWVKLMALSYPDDNTNWHIIDCEKYTDSGFLVRIDGWAGKINYRTSQNGVGKYIYSIRSLDNNTFYHIVVVKKQNKVVYFIDSMPDAHFEIPNPASNSLPFTISRAEQSFNGLIDDLKVYDRALSRKEIITEYKKGAESRGKDISWFEKFKVTPCFYEGKVVIEVDFSGILPLQKGNEVVLELGEPGKKSLNVRKVTDIPESGKGDFTFELDDLSPGEYEIRVILKSDQEIKTQESVLFHYPCLRGVASPEEKVVPPLPPTLVPVPYRMEVAGGGGFYLNINKETYLVESSFSFPHGGENRLLCSTESIAKVLERTATTERCPPISKENRLFWLWRDALRRVRRTFATDSTVKDIKREPTWQVETKQVNRSTYLVKAEGKHYRIDRRILLHPTHVTVKDSISNKTSHALGIILSNRINIGGLDTLTLKGLSEVYFGGGAINTIPHVRGLGGGNPTVFLKKRDLGLGLVPLDDVFIVQSKGSFDKNGVSLFTDTFALDANASYTLEWAIYPNSSGDYYDFINEVRKDEGRNNVTVEGGFAFISERAIPSRNYISIRNLKYGSVGSIVSIPDDPLISIEGLEFMEYPKLRSFLKNHFEKINKKYPDLKLMFHVAHQLYATNKPEEKFPDSRVIDRSGKHMVYDYPYSNGVYFKKERAEEGWRWYLYYPTLDNSLGKALLKSVDVMIDEIGCRGAFMDGFMCPHGGESRRYTYDRWDGHTAEIDPKTKTITYKMGDISLLSQEALIAFARKMRARGGVVIGNNTVVTRTFGREPIIHDAEHLSGGMPGIHLAPTPVSLGSSGTLYNEIAVYQDVRDKLKWGNLYFFYGEGRASLTHPSVPAQMYPITVQEIRSGYIKGRERLVTMIRSGVYGWPGDEDLHFAYLYNARGVLTPNDFLTTIDSSGVRTRIILRENETAVLKKIPIVLRAKRLIVLRSKRPINLVAQQYDAQAIQLVLNGRGKVGLRVRDGDFLIKPGAAYVVKADAVRRVTADKDGALSFSITLAGELHVRIELAD